MPGVTLDLFGFTKFIDIPEKIPVLQVPIIGNTINFYLYENTPNQNSEATYKVDVTAYIYGAGKAVPTVGEYSYPPPISPPPDSAWWNVTGDVFTEKTGVLTQKYLESAWKYLKETKTAWTQGTSDATWK